MAITVNVETIEQDREWEFTGAWDFFHGSEPLTKALVKILKEKLSKDVTGLFKHGYMLCVGSRRVAFVIDGVLYDVVHDQNYLKLFGEYYGYPECCIDYFGKEKVMGWWFKTGYMACPDCADRPVHEVVKEINERRLCPYPFPNIPELSESVMARDWATVLLTAFEREGYVV